MIRLWFLFLFMSSIYVTMSMMTGAWSDVSDLNSPELQKYGKLATDKLTASINSLYHLKMMNITKAKKQLVAGMNYNMEITIGPSQCKRFGNYSQQQLDDCPLQKCDNPLVCNVTVWVQPWLKSEGFHLTRSTCHPGDTFC